MKVLNFLLNIFKVYGFKIMNTLIAISILKNQVKNINGEIFNYVQSVVCPKISAPDEVRWTYLNLLKDSLWITSKDCNMSQVPGGTIEITFKNKSWFFKNTLGNVFTGIGPDSDNAEQMHNFYHAMAIFMHFRKNNEMMKQLNELFMKKQALIEAILALL